MRVEDVEVHGDDDDARNANMMMDDVEVHGDDGDDDEKLIDARDRLFERADDSYYFRVQLMCLFDPWSLRLIFHALLSLVIICLQLPALQTVWQELYLVKQGDFFDFEEYWEAGRPYPANYGGIFRDNTGGLAWGVPLLTWLPLVFCGGMLVLQMDKELVQIKSGYVLLHATYAQWARVGSKDLSSLVRRPSGRLDRWARLSLCFSIYIARVSLLFYFQDVALQLLGSSDGSVNILLNSLALVFILEADDNLYIDIPSATYFGVPDPEDKVRFRRRNNQGKAVLGNVVDAVTADPKHVIVTVQKFLDSLGCVVTAVCIILGALRMQHYTAFGKFVSVDDDSVTHTTHLTTLYKWLIYVLLFVLLVEHQSTLAAVFTMTDSSKNHARVALGCLLRFFFEGCTLIVIRVVLVKWVTGALLFYGLSAETWPLRFWNAVNFEPSRHAEPDEYS